ncbi:MAG: DUF2273 domain-containing protein [Clostridiaceae bacterium]|nr:DUF2273 domain-containing protein [Clostridiaceae bacterium]
MQDKKTFFSNLFDDFKKGGAGRTGALVAFVFALLLVIFGFWKTLFIIILTLVGYYIGVRYFSDEKSIEKLLNKIFPPGRFR